MDFITKIFVTTDAAGNPVAENTCFDRSRCFFALQIEFVPLEENECYDNGHVEIAKEVPGKYLDRRIGRSRVQQPAWKAS